MSVVTKFTNIMCKHVGAQFDIVMTSRNVVGSSFFPQRVFLKEICVDKRFPGLYYIFVYPLPTHYVKNKNIFESSL